MLVRHKRVFINLPLFIVTSELKPLSLLFISILEFKKKNSLKIADWDFKDKNVTRLSRACFRY